jgi:hypothetical protein
VATNFELGPTQTIYDKTYTGCRVHVYELTDHRVLVYAMVGHLIDAHIDDYFEDLLDAAYDRRPIGMIADPRQMRALSKAFQAAAVARFWPALARLGVRRNPAIMPETVIATVSVDEMIRRAGQRISTEHGELEIAMLPSLELCVQWVLSGPR